MTTYRYDLFGRMTGMKNDSITASYTYDGNGLRQSKNVNGVTTDYVYDGVNVIKAGTTYYSRGVSGLISAGENYYYTDYHGSVVRYGDSVYSYDAFGNEKNESTNDSNPFRYCGEYADSESGLVYLRARYYDSVIGAFVSEDPAKDGLNWYVYCSSDPVNYWDPSGMWQEGDDRFKNSNLIVYKALEALSNTWLNLEALKNQSIDSHINIVKMQNETNELANKIREIGDRIIVGNPIGIGGKLNDVEKVLYASDSNKGWEVFMSGSSARTQTEYYYGDRYATNGNSDAFRHAYWAALATSMVGSEYTRLFTNAHEYGHSTNFKTTHDMTVTYMDLYNNGVGIYQANINGGLGVGENILQKSVLEQIRKGGLFRVLVDWGPLVVTDGTGRIR